VGGSIIYEERAIHILGIMKDYPTYKRVELWEVYDRLAGTGDYADNDKSFLPTERYDWSLLTEIELFKNAVRGCKKVLDIGCGTGHPSLYVANEAKSIIGIDKSERMIEIARSRLRRSGLENVFFEIGDAENLRFANKSFDAVILCGSLGVMSNKEKCLTEARRVLLKGGELVCIEANWLHEMAHNRHFQREGTFVLTRERQVEFRYVIRSFQPCKVTDYRCVINAESDLGKKLLSSRHFLKHKTLKTEMAIKEVEKHCDYIEYDEEEKFDPETIASIFARNGFDNIIVRGYGMIYDLLNSVCLANEMAPYMKGLCKAEANFFTSIDPHKTEMMFVICESN